MFVFSRLSDPHKSTERTLLRYILNMVIREYELMTAHHDRMLCQAAAVCQHMCGIS